MSFVTRLRSAVQTRFDRLSRFTTYLAKDDEKDDENVKKEKTRPDISGLPELRETSWLANEVLKDLRISEEKQKNYVVNYVAGFMRATAVLQKQKVLPSTDSGLGSGCDLPSPNKKISRKSLTVEATQSKIESFTTRLANANIDVKCDRFSNENRRKILSGRLSDGLNVEFSKTKLAELMLKSGMKDTMFDYRIKKFGYGDMKKSTIEAFRILKRRAKNGDSEAQHVLDVIWHRYENGDYGSLVQSYSKAAVEIIENLSYESVGKLQAKRENFLSVKDSLVIDNNQNSSFNRSISSNPKF